MDTKFFTSVPPSMATKFLRNFFGKRVVKFIRYSWWPAEEVAVQCGIEENLAFSLTAGPLAVCFEDGSILGLASDPALNSVVVWDEAARCSSRESASLEEDDELFPISESGQFATNYWKKLVGQPIINMTFLMKDVMSEKELERKSEVGLRFHFEGGESFVASHGLHDNSDDFSVLEESQILKIVLKEFELP